ncbi:hypothetical protein HED63_22705 [Ochrobactrum cytisi]|nr:hypothetical protein [Brucella cytisi]
MPLPDLPIVAEEAGSGDVLGNRPCVGKQQARTGSNSRHTGIIVVAAQFLKTTCNEQAAAPVFLPVLIVKAKIVNATGERIVRRSEHKGTFAQLDCPATTQTADTGIVEFVRYPQ